MSETTQAPAAGAVIAAAGLIGEFARDGLPLVIWEVSPYGGDASLCGHIRRADAGEVRAVVERYGAVLGSVPLVGGSVDMVTVEVSGTVRGVEVNVWGVLYGGAGNLPSG